MWTILNVAIWIAASFSVMYLFIEVADGRLTFARLAVLLAFAGTVFLARRLTRQP